MMLKGEIQQKDKSLANIYAHNFGAPTYLKHILMDIKGGIVRNAVIVWYFNPPGTSIGGSSRQKINKDMTILNDTLDDMDFIGIFRAFDPKEQNIHAFQVTWTIFIFIFLR